MRRTLGTALIASCTLVGSATAAFAQQYPPEPVACVTLDASTYAPGDTVNGVGQGLPPGEELEVWLLSTPQLMTATTADGEGVAPFSFQIPTTIEPGTHHVQLVGLTSGLVVTSEPCTVVVATTPAVEVPGALPVTGQSSFPFVWLALAAIAFGTAVVVAVRRRTLARAAVDR